MIRLAMTIRHTIPVIARIYAVNSWQSTQKIKIKSARSANLLKSFLLLFCFCKKVEFPYSLVIARKFVEFSWQSTPNLKPRFLDCFGESMIRLAMTIRRTIPVIARICAVNSWQSIFTLKPRFLDCFGESMIRLAKTIRRTIPVIARICVSKFVAK